MNARTHDEPAFTHMHSAGMVGPVEAARDVVFGRAGGKDLLLDLFRPAGPVDELLAAVIFIHGGGWGGGDKKTYHDLAARVASHRYLCACVNYRLSVEAPFPAAVEDCKCAVRWVRAHASNHGADPHRIAVWGHSAGGHLAAMVALTPGQFEGEGGWATASSEVQCALCFSTPFDLTDTTPGLQGIINQFVGPSAADPEAARKQASPISYVAGKTTLFILFHGIEDVLPIAQSDRFAAALRDAGVPVELVRVPQAGHDLERFSPDIFEGALEFLGKHLKRRAG